MRLSQKNTPMKFMTLPRYVSLAVLLAAVSSQVASGDPGDFSLVQNGTAATIVVSTTDDKVVSLAANDLAADVESVTGIRPASISTSDKKGGALVIVGTAIGWAVNAVVYGLVALVVIGALKIISAAARKISN